MWKDYYIFSDGFPEFRKNNMNKNNNQYFFFFLHAMYLLLLLHVRKDWCRWIKSSYKFNTKK